MHLSRNKYIMAFERQLKGPEGKANFRNICNSKVRILES